MNNLYRQELRYDYQDQNYRKKHEQNKHVITDLSKQMQNDIKIAMPKRKKKQGGRMHNFHTKIPTLVGTNELALLILEA